MNAGDRTLIAGDIVQLDPVECRNQAFAGCLMVVTEPKGWGAQGYVQALGGGRDEPGGQAYYSAKWEEMEWVRAGRMGRRASAGGSPMTALDEARRDAEVAAAERERDERDAAEARLYDIIAKYHADLMAARAERDEARAKLAASPNPDAGHVVAFLTGLPVELNSLLPEGSIFVHPRTFNGLPPERPSWLDRMRAEAKTPNALDGDGRDGFNGSGPFEE